jgi:hypothetical protein
MLRRAPAGQLETGARSFGQTFDAGGATFFGDSFRRYEQATSASTTRSISTHLAASLAPIAGNKREQLTQDHRFLARCAISTSAPSSGGCKGGSNIVVWFVVGAFTRIGHSASSIGPVRDTWG